MGSPVYRILVDKLRPPIYISEALELFAPFGGESFFSLQLLLTPGGEHFFARKNRCQMTQITHTIAFMDVFCYLMVFGS